MKRIAVFALIIIIAISGVMFIYISLNDISLQETIKSIFQNEPNNKIDITVQTPMTLSNNEIKFNGQSAFLRLKMVKGKYYEDWTPGVYMGTLWEGSFIIQLADEYGKTIAETDISHNYNEPMIFNSFFKLEIEDYNNDDDPDFTIGQYASSNGILFRIFTIRKNGTVEELKVKDHSGIFISNTTGYYSTKLKKAGEAAFEIEYYNNAEQAAFYDTYKWDENQFILFESRK